MLIQHAELSMRHEASFLFLMEIDTHGDITHPKTWKCNGRYVGNIENPDDPLTNTSVLTRSEKQSHTGV